MDADRRNTPGFWHNLSFLTVGGLGTGGEHRERIIFDAHKEVCHGSGYCFLRLEEVLKDHRVDEDAMTEAMTFKDLGVDSLDVVEIILAVEERFGIEVSDDEMASIVTVRHAINMILKKTAG